MSQSGWTNLFSDLMAISAVSAGEVWAGGFAGHLLHSSGGTWTVVDPPVLAGMDVTSLSMAADGRGWAVAGGRLFQYNGSSWIERDTELQNLGLSAGRVTAVTADDAWTTTGSPDQVFHWTGSSWLTVPLPQAVQPLEMAMVSSTDGWMLARNGVLLHWDGSTWTVQSNGPGVTLLGGRLSAQVPGELWIVAFDSNAHYTIYRYRTGTWDSWALPDAGNGTAIYMRSATDGWISTNRSLLRWNGTNWAVEYTGRSFGGITGAPGVLWAAGKTDTIVTSTGAGSWTLSRGGPTSADLLAVSTLAADDVWAVGTGGVAIRGQAGTWQALPSTVDGDLVRVQMLSPTLGYAVGYTGTTGIIAAWNGTQWATVATPPEAMYGLSLTASYAGWAVGNHGEIWRLGQNGTWSPFTSPTTERLNAVAFDSSTHGWAGGGSDPTSGSAKVFEYTQGTWVDRSFSISAAGSVQDIVLDPTGQTGYMIAGDVDYTRSALTLQTGTWTPFGVALAGGIRGRIARDSDGTMWGPAFGGVFYYNGTWTSTGVPVGGNDMKGIAAVGGHAGWIVGTHGMILAGAQVGPAGITPTPTPTLTAVRSPTATRSPTPIISPTRTGTVTNTPTRTSTPSISATRTSTPATTPTRTATPPITATGTATSTATSIPSATATVCTVSFSDVQPSDYFYGPVNYLACRGVIGGYSDGTFRPYSTTTRGQLAKIVVGGFALPIQTPAGGAYTFTDNPPGSTFYAYIETVAARGIVSGYACGHTNPQSGVVEACDGASRPYYRPGNKVSRGQLAKIITGAAGWPLLNPATGHFSDVPVGSTFYQPVETAVCYGIVGGYSDGTFKPGSSALRGQISKIAYLAITYSGGCTP